MELELIIIPHLIYQTSFKPLTIEYKFMRHMKLGKAVPDSVAIDSWNLCKLFTLPSVSEAGIALKFVH